MNLNVKIGHALREERLKRGYSLAYVASKMNYSSRNTISVIELGKTQINFEQLEKYCAAIGCDMYELLRKVTDARL